jgi:hypothetical protein
VSNGIYATLIAVFCLALTGVAIAGSPPSWVLSQINEPTPEHDDKIDAIVLYSETVLTVLPDGQRKHLERRVYRILRNEGRRYGTLQVYFDGLSRVNSLQAWSIPKEGKPYDVGMRDALETSYGEDGVLVSDLRRKVLHIPAAVPGSVIGYEYEIQEKPLGLTDEWMFGESVPVRETRYTVQVPSGWSLKATWINHADQSPTTPAAGQSQWVLHDLKEIRFEDNMPPLGGVAGRLVTSLIPPDAQLHGFQNWSEMGTWYQGLTRDRTVSSAQIKQTVAQLAPPSLSQLARIQALAGYLQKEVRYVAIELGIGGVQPHMAADVLAHRYGDCKDKVTLLKTMLNEIGVESYYLIINSVRGSVDASTPANVGSFNHAVLAIRLPAGIDDPSLLAVQQHATLGRILFFDPTDSFTPLGSLSGALQANYGLLVAPGGGELIRTPQLPAPTNAVQRTAKMTLDQDGTLRGEVREIWSGDKGAWQRAELQSAAADSDVIKPVELLAANSFSTFEIVKAATISAKSNDKPFEWRYSLEAPNYAKPAGELILVRPRVIGSRTTGMLETPEPRRYPIEFEGAEQDTDEFEIALPAGYEVDELPPAVNLDIGSVAYHSKTEVVGRALRYTRTFELKEVSIPVAKAGELKRFFRVIGDDERNSAVLKAVGGSAAAAAR